MRKTCNCGNIFEVDNHHPNVELCKSCRKLKSKKYHNQYYIKNKDELNEIGAKWRDKNRKYKRQHDREYWNENKDEINTKRRERRATDLIYRARLKELKDEDYEKHKQSYVDRAINRRRKLLKDPERYFAL